MQDLPDVDAYLAVSERWPDVIAALRPRLLATGLKLVATCLGGATAAGAG